MFDNIQSFSFANIDKFSTAGLVTRLTTDITNVQNAYQMILRMCVRAPISMITAMAMAFFINAKLASIYLIAVIVLGFCLFLIMGKAMRYFKQIFPKYDDMNASVQENVSAIRVVKAYVREDYENEKFTRASGNIYQMFTKAEKILTWNAPLMQIAVYGCIQNDCEQSADHRAADESDDLLHEYSDEPDDAVHDFCNGNHECGKR